MSSFSRWLGRRWRVGAWADAMRTRNFAIVLDWFSTCFFVIGFVGLLLAGAAALGFEHWSGADKFPGLGLRVLALSFMFAAGCTMVGWLFGLLFGIPRSLTRSAPQVMVAAPGAKAGSDETPATTATQYRANTNLEEISDWLTKTIVGVGLTQLGSVPKALHDTAYNFNQWGFGWDPGGMALALGIILYFTPGGFWLGYVGTRTILTKLFDWIETSPLTPSQRELAVDPDLLDVGDDGKLKSNPDVAAVDNTILSVPLRSLNSSLDVAAWGAAQARRGNFSAAKAVLENALVNEPGNNIIKTLLSKVVTLTEKPPSGL